MKKKIVLIAAGAALLLLLLISAGSFFVLSGLPDVTRLKHYRPPAAAEVLDRNDRQLASFYDRSLRYWMPIAEVPEHVIRAVVIAEDDTFFEHQGVNYKATWDALVLDVKKRRFARGGSTITQQMIKNVFLTKEKTILRKLREYVLARRAEEVLSKREILQIYLNEVEWGEDLYGIEAASRAYFDKHVQELSVGEAALLAGMLPNPRYYNPFKHPDKAKERRDQVLSNMLQAHVIAEDEYDAAVAAPLNLRNPERARFAVSASGAGNSPCCLRVLEEVLLESYGAQGLYREGKRIRTTLDRDLQDMLCSRESADSRPEAKMPDQVAVVREGAVVRAFACESNEAAVRSWLALPGDGAEAYTVTMLPLRELNAADIEAPAPAETSRGN